MPDSSLEHVGWAEGHERAHTTLSVGFVMSNITALMQFATVYVEHNWHLNTQ